ncbi:DNA methyltransferase [Flavobacterium phage vB_FspS_snusmum6-1]|uniref:DNA methyltransferase n=3 Tax=Muminvirus snusmum TaxID=2844298 RepID=A0A6B9LU96_9CAUD|nr:DNA methyltransferase [Flavobacterium phage vB_FspS_snusmum6-1]QHB40579.1 DNA methyltransferase [Flavobacterium phage vB_FspS_snusmum6-1]QHB40651.1 DNA methyltransferase [Flavobacterium phage vB_FspS_snusmum6-2]QHB40724.1 DNA methyltransferase [Flavobacterium phage vB_FspS_snusmum6-3]
MIEVQNQLEIKPETAIAQNRCYTQPDLWNGDCLELMNKIPNGSIDAIITDPPYGTTACKWDSVIHFDKMWEQLNRIIKPNGAIVLFGSEPFSSALRMSNIKNYKYDWTWNKIKPGAFAVAKYRPLGNTENISVFALNKHNYYPIMEAQKPRTGKIYASSDSASVKYNDGVLRNYDEKYPKTLITFSNANNKGKQHPTQKPVELMEYLIKTYTNENETVLDFTMGSGSTGVACVNTNRKFIGIEKDEKYFEMAKNRIMETITKGCV